MRLTPETSVAALRTRRRLERQGAKLNNIAERIFMEIPSVERGIRAAIRKDPAMEAVPLDALERRMNWGG